MSIMTFLTQYNDTSEDLMSQQVVLADDVFAAAARTAGALWAAVCALASFDTGTQVLLLWVLLCCCCYMSPELTLMCVHADLGVLGNKRYLTKWFVRASLCVRVCVREGLAGVLAGGCCPGVAGC
jgi:hypothetical protein